MSASREDKRRDRANGGPLFKPGDRVVVQGIARGEVLDWSHAPAVRLDADLSGRPWQPRVPVHFFDEYGLSRDNGYAGPTA